MHDTRETDQVATYLAEKGEVVKQGADAFLIMNDGHIVRQSKADPAPQIIMFDRYIVDLVRFKPKEAASRICARASAIWTSCGALGQGSRGAAGHRRQDASRVA